MPLTRWLITFLAFPIGGFLAIETVGGVDGAGSGAAAGAIAGTVIGIGQGLALKDRVSAAGWAIHSAIGLSAGLALAGAVTQGSTTVADLMLTGLIAGAFVGAAQAPVLTKSLAAAAAWTGIVAAAWSLGWLVTSNVIVDAERGYTVFGASGAIVATLVTGVALRGMLRPATAITAPAS